MPPLTLVERARQDLQRIEAIVNVKSSIDCGPPKALARPPRPPAALNARREAQVEAALADIKMIGNIAREMARPPSLSQLDRRGPISLNSNSRRKELARIDQENERLLKRLEGAKPTYNKRAQDKAFIESRRHVALASGAHAEHPHSLPPLVYRKRSSSEPSRQSTPREESPRQFPRKTASPEAEDTDPVDENGNYFSKVAACGNSSASRQRSQPPKALALQNLPTRVPRIRSEERFTKMRGQSAVTADNGTVPSVPKVQLPKIPSSVAGPSPANARSASSPPAVQSAVKRPQKIGSESLLRPKSPALLKLSPGAQKAQPAGVSAAAIRQPAQASDEALSEKLEATDTRAASIKKVVKDAWQNHTNDTSARTPMAEAVSLSPKATEQPAVPQGFLHKEVACSQAQSAVVQKDDDKQEGKKAAAHLNPPAISAKASSEAEDFEAEEDSEVKLAQQSAVSLKDEAKVDESAEFEDEEEDRCQKEGPNQSIQLPGSKADDTEHHHDFPKETDAESEVNYDDDEEFYEEDEFDEESTEGTSKRCTAKSFSSSGAIQVEAAESEAGDYRTTQHTQASESPRSQMDILISQKAQLDRSTNSSDLSRSVQSSSSRSRSRSRSSSCSRSRSRSASPLSEAGNSVDVPYNDNGDAVSVRSGSGSEA